MAPRTEKNSLGVGLGLLFYHNVSYTSYSNPSNTYTVASTEAFPTNWIPDAAELTVKNILPRSPTPEHQHLSRLRR